VPPVFYPSLHEQPRKSRFSLTGYMALLIAVIMLPMLVLVTIIAWDYGTAARRTIEAQRLDVANNIKILIDREVEQTAGFLGGIATSAQGLRSSRPDVIARVSVQASARGFQSLIVYGLDGTPTPGSAEAAQRVPAALVGLAEIKAGAKFFVSNLIPDAAARPGLYFVSVPFMEDGKVVAVLAGGLQPRRLQQLLFEAGLREGWQAGIVDRNAILLARDRLPEMYVGVVGQPPMVAAVSSGKPSGLFDVIDRTGISVKNAFERSATTGWVVGVAVPTAVVNSPLWKTALIMTGLGIVMTLLSLLLAILVASHLSRSIRRLGIAAVAIASGDVVRMPSSNIAELQDVSRSIEVTGAVARRNRRADVTRLTRP
jgi:Na+-transporting methylmalonyl-CoA/oxaloacetate decarboxylase gamma subunit